MSERQINIDKDKSNGLIGKSNIRDGFYGNNLISSKSSENRLDKEKENHKESPKDKEKEVINASIKKLSVKKQKTETESLNNSKTSSKKNKRTSKGDMDSYSANRSLLIMEEINMEDKKKKSKKEKKKEKRYIVDNLDNIFAKLNEPKLKLYIQEMLLYLIVFMVCMYHWIFLFLSRSKIERNYCFGRLNQFDACSEEQICSDYSKKLNLILFNHTFLAYNNSLNAHELFIEENKKINVYYKPFYLRYSNLLSTHNLFSKIQMLASSNEKTNFVIVLSAKEQWNLFYRYFSLCEFNNYYIMFVVVISLGGVVGSLFFGYLSDIFGRRSTIRSTLLIITITTALLAVFSSFLDNYYHSIVKRFKENNSIVGEDDSYENIISELYAQERIRQLFKSVFNGLLIDIFFLSGGLWPLLKSCMALLIENSTGELKVLIGFRRYNFFFGGLPALFTSFFFANVNSFTITFIFLSCLNLLAFIMSLILLEESLRYYYEYCEWPKLTEVILNTYKVNIEDFRTLNDEEIRVFRKEENLKNFNNTVKKMNINAKEDNNNSEYIISNTFYNYLRERNLALNRNIKRDTDFVIKLNDVKSNPLIIIICLMSNRTFIDSKFLILIILIILYIINDLLEKELIETPFFSINDLYIDISHNYIINSVFFLMAIINVSSNFFFYAFYRINCFKTIIVVSLIYMALALIIYNFITTNSDDTPLDLNQYNFSMLHFYHKDNIPKNYLVILFTIYFALNGVNFFVYLLILKISKTIYRCTYFSIHSISLIAAMAISECIHYQMEHFFLFLCVLDVLCLLTFAFLSEFKELLYVINDLKIDIYRPSKNIQGKEKNE